MLCALLKCIEYTNVHALAMATMGGYRIEDVAPADQFEFAAHVEAVAVLRRG